MHGCGKATEPRSYEGKENSKEMQVKNEIRLALLCLAAASAVTAVPAFAQGATPLCGSTNFDESRNAFTIKEPAADAVNQQCFITVYYRGNVPIEAQQSPGSYLVEGTYDIELSGGGGGGGGGAATEGAGGGGGAGAAPLRTVRYLSPGVYKLTIGTGGQGGSANGGWTADGNPTSMTNAYTGALIAGFQGADVWLQQGRTAGNTDGEGNARGGQARAGGSSGGSGGSMGEAKQGAQAGGMVQSAGNYGVPGQAGRESSKDNDLNAGGGGGASVGGGGRGGSANSSGASAEIGDSGGGGGGGRSGEHGSAQAGARGGHGFIRLSMSK